MENSYDFDLAGFRSVKDQIIFEREKKWGDI